MYKHFVWQYGDSFFDDVSEEELVKVFKKVQEKVYITTGNSLL